MAGQPGRAAGCVCCMCRQFPPESRASAYKPHTRGGRRALWHLSICCRSRRRCCSHSWRHPPDNIRSFKCTLTVFIINAETRQGKSKWHERIQNEGTLSHHMHSLQRSPTHIVTGAGSGIIGMLCQYCDE